MKVSILDKTLTALLFTFVFLSLIVGMTYAQINITATITATPTVLASPTVTVVPSVTPTPNATVSPTPAPTIAPRQVFSSPNWNVDHETITIINNGGTINVTAWIGDRSNSLPYTIDAGATKTISTPTIMTQNGQLVDVGFDAYENGTLIDSYKATITISLGPTPTSLPPESITIIGTITDADNGSVVAGASVTFLSLNYGKTYPAVITGSDGSFTSPKMYPDTYAIRVTASGYQIASFGTEKITSDTMLNSPLSIKRLIGTATPTPTPSPTPTSIIDSWISLLYSPTLCFGTISAFVAIIAGSIGIYEWLARQRNARVKKEKEEKEKEEKEKQDAANATEKQDLPDGRDKRYP